MRGRKRLPIIRIVDAPADAIIGNIELHPIVDPTGAVTDHLVTRATGTGTTLLLGDVSSLRSRRMSELEPAARQVVHDLIARVDSTPSATVDVRLAERHMLVHLTKSAGVVTIAFARTDTAEVTQAVASDQRVERLRTLLAQFTDGIAMYEPVRDGTGAITDFVCLEMSDADPILPAHEQIGRRLLELYPDAVDNGTFAGYVQAITSGEPWSPEPISYVRGDQRFVYRVTARALDGTLVVSWRDILTDAEPADTQPTGEALTPRQQQILQAIADGRATTDIAADLMLSPFTIRNEVRRILAKLGVRTRAQAVSLAQAEELIRRR